MVEMKTLNDTPYSVFITTYLSYLILVIIGHLRDFFCKLFKTKDYTHLQENNGYAPLVSDVDSFFVRRLYYRIRDNGFRPITGCPGRTLNLLERESKDYNKTFRLTGEVRECLNLGSYNYLGFAQTDGACALETKETIAKYGVSTCGPRAEAGTLDLHRKLEREVARFVGKEDAIVMSMGFATNSTNLPALVEKGSLIISDELNHSSIVFGARLSNATIRTFKHNDPKSLENVLRSSISQGQPRAPKPWNKILVVVEGLYSMEGSVCALREIVELKKKYKFYLYMDEAHSIGALGPNGRGICDLLNVSTDDVDVMMGTFTKSFGAAGGYIAANKDVIAHLRNYSHGSVYAETISPPIIQQILTSLRIIAGEDGSNDGRNRIRAMQENSVYFRRRLIEMGFIIYGDEGSPIIPLLLFHPGKIGHFSRECLKRGLAVVVVGYPATPIITSRARFCISAVHSREDLDMALEKISEVGDILLLKHAAGRIKNMSSKGGRVRTKSWNWGLFAAKHPMR